MTAALGGLLARLSGAALERAPGLLPALIAGVGARLDSPLPAIRSCHMQPIHQTLLFPAKRSHWFLERTRPWTAGCLPCDMCGLELCWQSRMGQEQVRMPLGECCRCAAPVGSSGLAKKENHCRSRVGRPHTHVCHEAGLMWPFAVTWLGPLLLWHAR